MDDRLVEQMEHTASTNLNEEEYHLYEQKITEQLQKDYEAMELGEQAKAMMENEAVKTFFKTELAGWYMHFTQMPEWDPQMAKRFYDNVTMVKRFMHSLAHYFEHGRAAGARVELARQEEEEAEELDPGVIPSPDF